MSNYSESETVFHSLCLMHDFCFLILCEKGILKKFLTCINNVSFINYSCQTVRKWEGEVKEAVAQKAEILGRQIFTINIIFSLPQENVGRVAHQIETLSRVQFSLRMHLILTALEADCESH